MQSLSFLPYLRAFDAVAQHGSIRSASEELNLSPGAVSQQMQRLAEITGLELIEKYGRGIRLTTAGREFAKTVGRSLADLQHGLKSASEVEDKDQPQTLRISIPSSLGLAWLAGAIVEHAEREGRAHVVVQTCARSSDVDWNNTDIAIVYDNPPFDGLWWQLLSEVRLRMVCSPVLFHLLKLPRQDRQLRNVTLLHEDDGHEWARWSAASGIGIDEAGHTYFSSVGLALASALQGHGIALTSDVLAWTDIQQGRLIEPFSTEIPASSAYYIVTPSPDAGDPHVESMVAQFVGFIRDVRRQNPHKQGARSSRSIRFPAPDRMAAKSGNRRRDLLS